MKIVIVGFVMSIVTAIAIASGGAPAPSGAPDSEQVGEIGCKCELRSCDPMCVRG